jgi:microcystin-dependent protein
MADQINKLPSSPNVDTSVTKPTWDWLIKMGQVINQLVSWVNGYTDPTINIDTILPTQTGNSGKVLTTNGSASSWGAISGIPAGAVMTFAMNTPPTGWLECKAVNVSRTTYAALFAAIGTTFGVGDGSTTFGLPEMRGEFVRGWDDSRGVDTGRVFGSAQSDTFQGHIHTLYAYNNDSIRGAGAPSLFNTTNSLTGQISGPVTDGTNGTPRISAETRSRNISLLYCIKT